MGLIFLLWLLVAAVNDALNRKCFNWVVMSGSLIAVSSVLIYPESHPVSIDFMDSLLGAVSAFFVLLIFYGMKMMGAGDVKFAAVLGLWIGWRLLLPIWALSCLFAVVHGLFSRSSLRNLFCANSSMKNGVMRGNEKFIPYITYLSLASIIVMGFYKNQ